MDDIAGWRSSIDEIDAQLLKLLNERARCAHEIGRIKKKHAMAIHNPAREQEILTSLREKNKGPLSHDAIHTIFGRIIEECKALEKF